MDNFFNQLQVESSPLLQSIGRWIYFLNRERALLFMYLHIIIAALFPLYTGAHASLRCPPSAKPPPKKSSKEIHDLDDLDDELDDIFPEIQGLQPSDAIMFPVTAGVILGGLYLLIKWLDDPKLLSRILNWYFSGIGVMGVGKLTVDTLNVITSFAFPSEWSTQKEIYYIGSSKPTISGSIHEGSEPNSVFIKIIRDSPNPLPGFLSSVRLPEPCLPWIRYTRALFRNHLIFRGYIQNLMRIAVPVRLNHVIGYIFGLIVIILYNILGRPWWLTNLMAFGFCYSALQLISPTTFWTGTLVLSSLFIYDIIMVFYTPLMITVASSLDIPIKMVFPGPKKGSMLGLGDIVLPGIMIALALRFDLYLHYLKKQKRTATLSTPESDNKKVVTSKPDYIEATGVWGERYWTSSLEQNKSYPSLKTIADGARFRKVYFWASMIGYMLALIVTLFVLKIFNHAQPALLYLVPGVLFPLWGTAWVRGEIATMYNYTEDSEWGPISNSENKKNSHITDTLGKKSGSIDEKGVKMKEGEGKNRDEKITAMATEEKRKCREKDFDKHRILLFSLTIPKSKKCSLQS